MTPKINLSDLSVQERKDLLKQAKELAKQEAAIKQVKLSEYRQFKDDTLLENFTRLQSIAVGLNAVKSEVTKELETIIDIKRDVLNVSKIGEYSQTLSTENGQYSIQIGRNVIDGWNDEVHEGIAVIKAYLKTLISDDKSKVLISFITDLLARNMKGDLKASRVLKLKNACEKFGSPSELVKGLKIIENSYLPKVSSSFLRAWTKDQDGTKNYLNLSTTA